MSRERRQAGTPPARQEKAQAHALTVHVRPRAGATGILGMRPDGSIDVTVRAAPAGGEANRELTGLLARAFGVPRSAVHLVRGLSLRTKVVRIEGVNLGRDALAAVIAGKPASHRERSISRSVPMAMKRGK